MSDLPMTVPLGLEKHQYAELCILLPPHLPINGENYKLMEEAFKDDTTFKLEDLGTA